MQPNKNNICTTCQKGTQINKEFSPGLTITYFTCGHRQITAVVNETIEVTEQINQDISKDYEELGKTYIGGALYAKVETPQEKGKRNFDMLHDELFEIICVKHKACEKMDSLKGSDIAPVIDVIVGIISGVLGNPFIPCVTVARIITKKGIKKFCKCD